ncbi:hypothetical protein LRS74_19640 [Streptomyces sp. LX-29]|uniref:hypothetical protein n=1 Tax=Streptomyces sp. LX-29 TaxID=2900152 RepID=UPI00240E66DC|nr:hypothetical protein [Streptomyces sp. LX-29]WFB09007.1 hypothetical protein LRS74_19640 [Streptomyces sp. LX-29]
MGDDHRYSWLDEDAVERLLRGEPVETYRSVGARDDQSRMEAERLAAVLDVVATPTPPPGDRPLPGEDAAVAAFRAGQERAARACSGGSAPSRLRRPLRAGMVAALAGCAFGGMAVAAAAGVLPTPFNQSGDGSRPGSAVSAAGSGTGTTAEPRPSEDGSTTSSTPSADGSPGDPDAARPTGPKTSRPFVDGRGEDETGDPETGRQPRPRDEGREPQGRGKKHWALVICRTYLAAKDGDAARVDPEAIRRLERAAGGPEAVRAFCEQVVARNGGADGGRGGGSDDGSGDGGRSGGDHGDDGSRGGEDDGPGTDGGGDPAPGPVPTSTRGPGTPPPPPPPPAPTGGSTPAPSDAPSGSGVPEPTEV